MGGELAVVLGCGRRSLGVSASCLGGDACERRSGDQHLDTRSPQPRRGLRTCVLLCGGAKNLSVTVGLAETLRLGELVDLINVGLGDHDVDGREHVLLLLGLYRGLYPCLTRPGITRWVSYVECANAGCVGATLRVSNKKNARRAWQLCQALDGYSLSLSVQAINRANSKMHRTKNQVIAKKSGRLH